MVTTRGQHYRSPSPTSSQGRSSEVLDVKPVVAADKAFQLTSAWGTTTRSHVFWWDLLTRWKRRHKAASETNFLVARGPFPCKIGAQNSSKLKALDRCLLDGVTRDGAILGDSG